MKKKLDLINSYLDVWLFLQERKPKHHHKRHIKQAHKNHMKVGWSELMWPTLSSLSSSSSVYFLYVLLFWFWFCHHSSYGNTQSLIRLLLLMLLGRPSLHIKDYHFRTLKFSLEIFPSPTRSLHMSCVFNFLRDSPIFIYLSLLCCTRTKEK